MRGPQWNLAKVTGAGHSDPSPLGIFVMRLALLAALLFAVPAGAVAPFSWNIFYSSSIPSQSFTISIPDGMVWHVEQVTGFGDLGLNDVPVAGVYSTGQHPAEYLLLLTPSMIHASSTPPNYFADYSRSLSVKLTGDLSMRGANGNALPDRLVLSGYLTPTLAGDYSGDGVANAADYTVLRDNAVSWEPSDMASWRTSYGTFSADANSVTIPEPTAIALAAMLFSGLGLVRRNA